MATSSSPAPTPSENADDKEARGWTGYTPNTEEVAALYDFQVHAVLVAHN